MGSGVEWRIEEAKLLWAQGQKGLAVRVAKLLLNQVECSGQQGNLHAQMLCLAGKWLAETR